jgi:hypothetical protein
MSFKNPSHYAINMMSSSQSNFNNAFLPNPNFIPQRDTKNTGHMLHNNMNDNVDSEFLNIVNTELNNVDNFQQSIDILPVKPVNLPITNFEYDYIFYF